MNYRQKNINSLTNMTLNKYYHIKCYSVQQFEGPSSCYCVVVFCKQSFTWTYQGELLRSKKKTAYYIGWSIKELLMNCYIMKGLKQLRRFVFWVWRCDYFHVALTLLLNYVILILLSRFTTVFSRYQHHFLHAQNKIF